MTPRTKEQYRKVFKLTFLSTDVAPKLEKHVLSTKWNYETVQQVTAELILSNRLKQ